MTSPFGTPKPGVALATAPDPTDKTGPLHQVEFVIEVVGPSSVPAPKVAALLQAQWMNALGQPRIWVMAPANLAWQPLAAGLDGSYDSLALTWALLSDQGNLTSRSALTLLSTAERYASTIHRRALPMPPPVDVDAAVRGVSKIARSLDIGISLGVMFVQPLVEETVWRTAVELGLGLNPHGEFVWGDPAQLTLLPLNDATQFTLNGVRACRSHEGLSIGFSVPRVVSPTASLAAAFKVADEFASRFRGLVVNDEGTQMTPAVRAEYSRNLQLAAQAFESTSLVPGSAEALRLFGG